MSIQFVYDDRLGIRLPELDEPWESHPSETQIKILAEWETIRGSIPDRIKQLDQMIREKQQKMDLETDFPICCRLNYEISELASCITDLHLWYRMNQEITEHAPSHL